jgi:mono/diheme cytochrome c family protein
MKRNALIDIAMILSLGLVASSCSKQTESTVWQYMPHMATTPNLKAMKGYTGNDANPNGLKGSSMLMPPEGTIARGHKPFRFEDPEDAARALVNPLPRTKANIERGRKIFNTNCFVCHGERGLGDGPVVNPFPVPKSLQSDDMLKWKDGHLFYVITKGQGVMPSYAQQVQPEDRWAVIHYVRALQRAEHPTDEDLRALKERAK